MTDAATYLALLAARAQWLAPLVMAAMLLGDPFSRGPFEAVLARGEQLVARLGRLDKKKRGVARLVYRGMIALMLLLIPTMAASIAIEMQPWHRLVSGAFFFLWFGHCFQLWRSMARWHRAKADGLKLELPGLDYLFADSHALVRYLVATRLEAFAVGIVGASFWYILGGLPVAIGYLILATAATAYRDSLAFGWAARGLFQLMDVLPRFIARILLTLAAIFTPQTHPLAALNLRPWRVAMADLIGGALGGPGPNGNLPWAGNGTARLGPEHLRRVIGLLVAAGLLFSIGLAGETLVNLLKTMH